MRRLLLLLSAIGLISSCGKDPSLNQNIELVLGEMIVTHPADNLPNSKRVNLGRYLFYNPAISIDSTISCGSCHNPSNAFSKNEVISAGVGGKKGFLNAPSLSNIGNHPYFTAAGGVPTLEMQILIPIQEEHELNFNIVDLAKRLKKDTYFINQAKQAYPNRPYHYVITRSIAAFERTLVSTTSRFDEFLKGKTSLNSDEQAGMNLFYSKRANCSSCHSGINFTNYSFKSNGLTKITQDSGKYRLSKKTKDIGLYKVPSLRNLKYTFPYMHDGSIIHLKEVIKRYSTGTYLSGTKSTIIKPIQLSTNEIEYLMAFLNTLNDEKFISNPNLRPK